MTTENITETGYLLAKEQELLEQIQRQTEWSAEQKQLAIITGVADEAILATLQELGYTRETVRLLYLVPLVQVAWASGSVTARERELVFEAASLCGVRADSALHQQLSGWLDQPPEAEFLARTLRVIRDITALHPPAKRAAGRRSLVAFCTNVAEASGGILGFGSKISAAEQEVLNQIVDALTIRTPDTVQEFVANTQEDA